MTRGKLLTIALVVGLLFLALALFRSCQGSDGHIDEREVNSPASLRVSAPANAAGLVPAEWLEPAVRMC